MWFAKLFGIRRDRSEGLHPQSQGAAIGARTTSASRRTSRAGTAKSARIDRSRAIGHDKGFDPYNSGAFERRNAWERVGRR